MLERIVRAGYKGNMGATECLLEDPAAANDFGAIVEDGGLAGGDGTLRIVKHCEHGGINLN